MHFDFAAFNVSLFLSSHELTFVIYWFNSRSMFATSFTLPKFSRVEAKVLSSAYIIKSNFVEAWVISFYSFMSILKRSGPKTEPCGIPHVVEYLQDLTLSSCTY